MANTKVWLLGLSVLFYASGCFVVTDPPAAPEQPSDVADHTDTLIHGAHQTQATHDDGAQQPSAETPPLISTHRSVQ